MKSLYKFSHYFGRHGSLEGVFVATEEDIKKIMGQRVYFGEVLGKHSEVEIDAMEESDIKLLTSDQDFIAKAIEFGIVPMGTNPVNTWQYMDENYVEKE